ncbi:MAG TPA: hypothetical protein PK926_11100 [Spirochaetota bacterium]|nr:hypothetical protein [Spirochaetota bacterium]HPI91151.1 hypothetical protein [Spirochaetota bacterium]HPR47861.1 hypothetical protein [Spirochaetota bacterium]
MHIKDIISTVSALLMVFALHYNAFAGEKDDSKKSTRISWNESDGIIRYDILIKNESEAVVLNKSVEHAEVEFVLPPGTYWIQITAINKFEKVSDQSDWQKFQIKEAEKKIYVRDLLNVGLKISAGYAYTMPLTDWKEYYQDSYITAMLRLSLNFGKLGLLKKYRFFRYFGMELDGSFTQFEGKQIPNKLRFDSKNILAGANIFFTTGLSIPINLMGRFGAGASFTLFEYDITLNTGKDLDLWSTDPYILGGMSIEITFYQYLYFELGADFVFIDYLGDDYMGLRYFFMVGVRL